ncbi:uncharacterized protein F4817DRAFT_313746 [Daldinia loculata]|uniref:uncharacterized protein n=1 Tax=Daldinia loculata TaxID=103429 RepID=UPI0020C57AEC|nr:uncharacterized protein F4817DRAFT_313746 [Daldinia loculata]KAI1649606.1 hypothetical protein F4817DRAFT_313746 [Daldinia loculata]
MSHSSGRLSPNSKPGANDRYPSTTISSISTGTAYTGDTRVPYNDRIRSLRRSPDGHRDETTPAGGLASVPPTSDPREPRPPVSHSPPVLSMLANSTQVTETAESLRNLRLSMAGLESRGGNNHLFNRRAHVAEETAAKKKSIDTTDERRRKHNSQPTAPLSRKIAVPISAEMAEGLIAVLDELSGRNSKKSGGKKKDDGKKKHDGKDKKHHKKDDKRDDDHKPRKDGQTQT